MKMIEKKLPIGRWRITLVSESVSGHDITGVALKGWRGRAVALTKVTQAQFHERCPLDANGEFVDPPALLRAVPIMWFCRGKQIYLWPAPAQEWTVEITLEPKDKGPDLRTVEASATNG